MVRREGSSIQARVFQSVAQRLGWAARRTNCTRRQMLRARLLLCGSALIVAAGSWRPAPTLAQLPTGTPTYNVNAKWVTDRGSQVYNVKAYGATGNGTTDDTAAINATITAAGTGGTILLPPGTYLVSSQLQLTADYQVMSAYGAAIKCNLASATDCIMIGTIAGPAYAYSGISILGLEMIPGTNTSANASIRTNGQDTHLADIHWATNSGYYFLHLIQDDNDQNLRIDHMYNTTGVVLCSGTTCGSELYGNPSNGTGNPNAGIAYVYNSNFSSNCSANGIDWQSGNHLTISSSEFQAWSQYALRTVGPANINGWTHWEQGGCTNPLNDGNGHALGGAGLISLGGSITVEGSAPGGTNGTIFSTNASGGSTTYAYYAVGHTSSGVTAPLVIGYLSNGPATISSSAENFLVWPALTNTGVINWDILRTTGATPYGTGAYAVATGVTASSACGANGVCAYTDNVGTLSSYTVASESLYPNDLFWPGNLVLFANPNGGTTNAYNVGSYSGPAVAALLVNSAPSDLTDVHVVFAGTGNFWSGGAPTGPGFVTGGHSYAANLPAPAELFPRSQPFYSTKGWLNFGAGGYGSFSGNDYLTLNDSNWSKTLADPLKHPTWDASDTTLCSDAPSSGACLRGPSVSQYVSTLPDGSHWATRTASTGIADAVPHYGFQSISSGAPNTPTLTDESSASTCQRSHGYSLNSVCYMGSNFVLAIWTAASGGSVTGATAPTLPSVGSTVQDGYVTWLVLPAGSLAANTTYYFKTAGCTLGGCSGASSEVSVTTANDSASHMVLLTGMAKAGHTSYQVGCATTSGGEAPLAAPWTGAYTGNGYVLPAMSCSGSGSFNTSDQSGYVSVPALCFNGANCNTSWPSGNAAGLIFGSTTLTNSSTAPTSGQCLYNNSGTVAGTNCSAGYSLLLNTQGPLSAVQGTGNGVWLFQYTLPANTVSSGQGIRITTGLIHSTGSSSVTYGVGDAGVFSVGTFASAAGACRIVLEVMASGSSSGTYTAEIACGNGLYVNSGTTSFSWASAQTFGVNMTVGTSDYVTPLEWLVEYLH